MKWRQETVFHQSPFKLLESGRSSVDNGVTSVTPTMSLGFHRLATKNKTLGSATWPRPRMKRSKCKVSVTLDDGEAEEDRPRTATLERPKVLDVSLLGKIDMTNLTKKSLMSIANLCILPVKQEIRRNGGCLTVGRIYKKAKKSTPQHSNSSSSSPSPALRQSRRSVLSKETMSDVESTSCKNSAVPHGSSKTPIKSNYLKVRSHGTVINREKSQDSNNNEHESRHAKTVSRPKTVIPKKSKHVDEVFGGQIVVPEPCTTCGRPELPERLHSHPVATGRAIPRTPLPATPTPPVKSSVRKPVAIKYRSTSDKAADSEKREAAVVAVVSPPPNTKGPRTVMCYVCGRGFGTASYPLHEPQCLQKWERENAVLPSHLQRPVPRRPDLPANSEEWNRLAFQASQSQLVSCKNCGRTFNPDRLVIHLRSCRPDEKQQGTIPRTPDSSSNCIDPDNAASTRSGPPAVHCFICGRMFGTKSISIHEPHCLEKWRAENEKLPSCQRRPEPVKPDPTGLARVEHVAVAPPPPPTVPAPTKKSPAGVARRGRTIPCYLCGREFFAGSINIHEPQCLVKWHMENDKLPPDKRRREPEKPDVKFTATGAIDFQGTMDAIWETHLQQLVPCKHCGRTFNPDRVDVHERSCKGPRH